MLFTEDNTFRFLNGLIFTEPYDFFWGGVEREREGINQFVIHFLLNNAKLQLLALLSLCSIL